MRLKFPRSLQWQFALAQLALVAVVVAAGALAVHRLQVNVQMTSQLASGRLERLEQAQEVVRLTLQISREAERMSRISTRADLQTIHASLTEHLYNLDRLVDQLVSGSDALAILSLRQSAQMLRNNVHVSVGLHDGMLSGRQAPAATQQQAHRFDDLLQRESVVLAVAAQAVLQHYAQNYRDGIEQLMATSHRAQGVVVALLLLSLLLAWVVYRLLLKRHIVSRLQAVSRSLRESTTDCGQPVVPVQGNDEIGAMARSVERFLRDRCALVQAHRALTAEHQRQEELLRKLAQANSQLLQSEKLAAIGQLAAGVAHEINNPIGFVSSNLHTLQRYQETLWSVLDAYEAEESVLPEPVRAALASTREQADLVYLKEDLATLLKESVDGLQRVTRIVRDLKNFAHVDEADVQWADLEAGLDSTLNVAWNEIKYKAEVIKEYGGIPKVECVASQINQVFMNLLINAAQAIEQNGKITLRTRLVGDRVAIEIADTGSGIAPQHIERIFEPFFTTKPVGKGTGLGLSLTHSIVKKHGGTIEVSSEVGVGTTFRVLLPIRAVASAAGSVSLAD